MSIKWMSAVWEDKRIDNQSDLLVMLAIADFANDKGFAWPSIDSISSKSRHSDRGVQKILSRLQTNGFLEIKRGAGPYDTNVYQLRVNRGEPGSPSPERGEPPGSPNPSVPVNSTPPLIKEGVGEEGGTGGNRRSPRTAFTPPSLDEVIKYCESINVPVSDAQWFFFKGEGNGWTNGGHPIKNWKGTIQSWKAGKYLPSLKATNGNGNGHGYKQPVNPNVPPPINGF